MVPSDLLPTEKGFTPRRASSPTRRCSVRLLAHCGRFLAAASRRSRGRLSVPVWLAVLSDQLPIIALGSRYPPNKLIGRRPRQGWLSPFFAHPTGKQTYAELPTVSGGYPPPQGRLPTCYAPVRRVSGPKPTPLDLHALGTPPALILSQDQTLHQYARAAPQSPSGLRVFHTCTQGRDALPALTTLSLA